MQRIKRRSFLAANSFAITIVTFAIACVLIGIICFQYYSQLQSTIRSESSGYLQEIARRIGDNIDRTIADNYANLSTVATILEFSGVQNFSDIEQITLSQKQHWNFDDIIFINEAGKAYNSSGNPIVLNSDNHFTSAVLEKRSIISNTQMVDGEERILLSLPLDGLFINGEHMVAVAASYNPSSFDETLSMKSFDGNSSSCIINGSGTVIVRPSGSGALDTGYNVLSTIAHATIEEGGSIDAMKKDMEQDRGGQIAFSLDDTRYYAVYTPVDPENWYLLTFVPTNVVNARSDMLLDITILLCGLITLVSASLIAFVLFIASRNKKRLEHLAYNDDITQGNTIERFFEMAATTLVTSGNSSYALVYSNIEKFKVLNEQYGEAACNDILRMFYRVVSENLYDDECIGRQSADNFCILVRYEGEESLRRRILTWYIAGEEHAETYRPTWALPVVEFGIFVIDDTTLSFPQMIDRAKLALREFHHSLNSKVRYAVYNDEVRRRLLRDKELEDMMETALASGNFHVYLQPKYRLPERVIGGAEALTRWEDIPNGMIYPDEFIPLFERNGFIIQLDLWVFEEVCKHLRAWIDAGLEPLRISVNCSRLHLRSDDFLENYCNIAKRYNVPREYLEIELTESIVMEDSDRFIGIINEIHAAGFSCSIDDFGSGYSSLNLIQSLPVDTMKLDKIFFREDGSDAERLSAVVESIISMAKALSMETVAEGIEIPEQVDMLEHFGCDYVQGYVFARPMPISDFEQLAFGRKGGVR